MQELELKYGPEWYISDLTAAAKQEESLRFPSLGGVPEQGENLDPNAISTSDVLRDVGVDRYDNLSPEERAIKIRQDNIDFAMHLPGAPVYDDFAAQKEKNSEWYADYEEAREMYRGRQIVELAERLGVTPEEAAREYERVKNFYKTESDLEYERIEALVSEAEDGRPAYDPTWSSARKKQWYREDQQWLREQTAWLAEQLGVTYEEAKDILATRKDRRKELRGIDPSKDKDGSTSAGRSWSSYSRYRGYYSGGRSYGGRSNYYGSSGGSGYYGGSSGGYNGGGMYGNESELLPSIESYVQRQQRLVGALWNTPKSRYIK